MEDKEKESYRTFSEYEKRCKELDEAQIAYRADVGSWANKRKYYYIFPITTSTGSIKSE